jgi:BirA family biotin operon repressor/biotin-[acetyl-CoA-carboxylase] ligase
VELLDEKKIRSGLPATLGDQLRSLTVLREVDSTNSYLLGIEGVGDGGVHACVAEAQSAGRGRRGRTWVSPFGANLYLSVLRTFSNAPESVQGLSLAVGVAVARAMQSLDVRGVALKWPNDIQLGGQKLGGILLETSGTSAGPWRVVAGIGINLEMPRDASACIDQPWTDLASHGARPGRNRLASRVLAQVIAAVEQFAESGFASFRHDWERLDALRDRQVELRGSTVRCGIARGVDARGALLVDLEGRRERIVSGDISPRVVT